MSKYPTQNLRTVAFVGHGGSGKTSLIEAMLMRAGAISECGSVDKGTTVCDSDPQEKQVGHSLRLAVAHMDTDKLGLDPVRIHVLDTPGYPDYIGQSLPALDAVKSAVIVVDATKGVELMTERMMNWAEKRGLCRMIVINKIDVPGVDLMGVLDQLKLTFKGMTHVIDCYNPEEGESDIMSVSDVHRAFIERVVEVDDATMERYLEEGDADPASLHAPITKALREGHIIPVCFTSAKNLIGIRDFMKVIIRHLPSPAEANVSLFEKRDGTPIPTEPSAQMPVLAHVFKIISDPFVGKIGIFRVHQGQIRPGSTLYIDDSRKPIKVNKPLILQGKDTSETDELNPGDIGALNKVDDMHYGAILHSSILDFDVRMKPLEFPQPMFGLDLTPLRRGDESRMSDVLNKMLAEDPTLKTSTDPVLNKTMLQGLSELHLRTVLDRMKAQFNFEVQTCAPSVPYRETISGKAEGHARHKKQSGGAGQFGVCYINAEPLPRGEGFKFVDQIVGGAIPRQFIPAVEKGIVSRMESGPMAGYPVTDVAVELIDGKYHPVDSKEVAFQMAGKKAIRTALEQGGVKLLEPVYKMDITIPSASVGDIMGDITSRRGRVLGMDPEHKKTIIHAICPLAEIQRYAPDLRSMTSGQGIFTMEFEGYEDVPSNLEAKIIKESPFGGAKDEDDE